MKHLRVLEDAGLVTRLKEGRVVRCELAARPMQEAAMWLAHYEKFWNDRLDALGRFLYHHEEEGQSMAQSPTYDKPSLVITRHYRVPPEKVWRAWTEPQALSRWFGPGEPDSVTRAELDVRVGGRYHIAFRTQDGQEHDVSGVYQEVVVNRKLEFTWAWKSTPDRVSRVMIELLPEGGGCELRFRHDRFFDQAARDSHQRGWTATFEKLDHFIQS